MISSRAYFELTNLMGRYANCRTTGRYDLIPEMFTEYADIRVEEGRVVYRSREANAFAKWLEGRMKETKQEFFSVFSQLCEIREDENEARCTWMYLEIVPNDNKASHTTGRIDLVCARDRGVLKIRDYRQYARTSLVPARYTAAKEKDFYVPVAENRVDFMMMENEEDISELLDIENRMARYVQHLHCSNAPKVRDLFLDAPDTSWTVDSNRRRYLAEHPDYKKEEDGPGTSDEPPYWMGASFGVDNIMQGFADLVEVAAPENKGIYSGSQMLIPLIVKNKETGYIYSSSPAYGGFIVGPIHGTTPPYPCMFGTSKWYFEWVKNPHGEWKVHHFFWSTFDCFMNDLYDPGEQKDWISTHSDLHDWPALPEPY